MSLDRPTLTAIINRIGGEMESRFLGADTTLRRSVLRVLTRAFAGNMHLSGYGTADFLSKQLFADLATTEYLERAASIWGLTRLASVKAAGTVTVTGSVGSTIASGSELTRSDGERFVTTGISVVIPGGGSASLTVEAVDGGEDGNTGAGQTLTFSSPPSGVSSETTVDSTGLVGGVDEETDEQLRTRLLARLQAPPHGGTAIDYVNWALGYITDETLAGTYPFSGITRAWCFPLWNGDGTVALGFVQDDKADYPNFVRDPLIAMDNLVENGDFADGTAWSLGDGWSIAAGVASCDGTQSANTELYQHDVKVHGGYYYTVQFTVSNYSAGGVDAYLGGTASGSPMTGNGTFKQTFAAGSLPRNRIAIVGNATFVGDIDDVSVTVWSFGTNWSLSGGKLVKVATSATAVTQEGVADLAGDWIIKSGRTYRIKYTISDSGGVGTVTPALGGVAGTAETTDGDYEETIVAGGGAAEGRIAFSANATWYGKIDNIEALDERATEQPDIDTVLAMHEYLDLLKPVGADLTVAPLAMNPVSFTLAVVPNTTVVKDAVHAALVDLFYRESEPAGTLLRSRIVEAIAQAEGETNHTLTVPASDVSLSAYDVAIVDWTY